jgi:hypothetical protein
MKKRYVVNLTADERDGVKLIVSRERVSGLKRLRGRNPPEGRRGFNRPGNRRRVGGRAHHRGTSPQAVRGTRNRNEFGPEAAGKPIASGGKTYRVRAARRCRRGAVGAAGVQRTAVRKGAAGAHAFGRQPRGAENLRDREQEHDPTWLKRAQAVADETLLHTARTTCGFRHAVEDVLHVYHRPYDSHSSSGLS